MITKKRERWPWSMDRHWKGLLQRITTFQNVAPISYSKLPLKKAQHEKKSRVVIKEVSQPEVYTEEHDKLLGNTEKTWKLFVDGVGKDGKRIYDSFRGKTCHQFRQMTLGYRTRCCCCECKPVRGQFCGDCLYMRYGEHVLEALADPTWIYPVCRGICNCSLCRQEKGWAPTGALHKKIEICSPDAVKLLASSTKPSLDEQDQLVTLEKVKGSDTVRPLASSTKPSPDS